MIQILVRIVLLLAIAIGPASAQSLRIGTQSPFVVDPHYTFLGPDMAAARHIYDSFVGRDAESNWVPGLAVAWTAVDDHTWEFKLRPGVTFSDGTPFTADDVAFSFDRVMTLQTPSSFVSNMRTIVRTNIVDALTVRVTTDRPNATLPGQLTNIFIVSAKLTGAATSADFQSGRLAVGTGPFKLVSYNRGVGMELVRNDLYWGPRPAWAAVSVRVITNDASRVAALLAGDLDMIDAVGPAYVSRLEHSAGISVYKHASDRVMFLQPNTRLDRLPMLTDAGGAVLPVNPLRDIRVRRALSLAIDRVALTARALDGQAIPATQLVPPGFGGYDAALPILPYDPAAARALLAEAGYPAGFGMTIACTNNRYVADEKVCQVVAQMLERVGIRMKVETLPASMLFPRARPEVNEWPLLFMGQSNSVSRDPTHVLSLALHSFDGKGMGASNRGGFSDPALDTMIDDAVRRLDDRREDGLHAAMMKGVAVGAAIPLFVQTVVAATRTGITYQPRMDEQTVAQGAAPAR